MINIELYIQKAIPLIKNSIFSALIFAISVFCFYLFEPISHLAMTWLHISFYLISFVSILTLLYFNQRKPIFFIIISLLSYILINLLKLKFPNIYATNDSFLWLKNFIPLNLLILYFLPQNKLLSKENIYLIIIIFLEIAIGEKLSLYLPNISFLLFFITSTIMLGKATQTGYVLDYSLFYATVSLMLGIHYYTDPTAITVFFSSCSLIILVSIIQDLIYKTYKDELTNFYSRNAYIIHSNTLPLKYSIAIINIDDYDKLGIAFKKRGLSNIVRMLAIKIAENLKTEDVYRYNKDEFLIIFKDESKENAFEVIEGIRRSIASSKFKIDNKNKIVNLTVTCIVTEKKRSDANSNEVIKRAKKVLQKTLNFSHNISSKT